MTQLALFDEPPREPRKLRKAPIGVRYTPYRPAKRVLCRPCVEAIHYLGVANAPFPQPARWKRIEPNVDGFVPLCHEHKREEAGE